MNNINHQVAQRTGSNRALQSLGLSCRSGKVGRVENTNFFQILASANTLRSRSWGIQILLS